MKRMILGVMIAAMFCSCTKEPTGTIVEKQSEEGIPVTLAFTSGESNSRSFFDESSKTEPWEREVNSLNLWCYTSDGDLLKDWQFNTSDLDGGKNPIIFLPETAIGKEYTFYAVANYGITAPATAAAMEEIEAPDVSHYNGEFALTGSQSKRPEGFVMSCKTKLTISAGQVNILSILLKRTVAKIAFRVEISDDFKKLFPNGKVFMGTASLSNYPTESYLFYKDGERKGNHGATMTQTPGNQDDGYNYVFYIHEQQAQTLIHDYLRLKFQYIYDRDGDINTTDDQDYVEKEAYLDGTGEGRIIRNGYYRVYANIKDLKRGWIEAQVVVEDWVTTGGTTIFTFE